MRRRGPKVRCCMDVLLGHRLESIRRQLNSHACKGRWTIIIRTMLDIDSECLREESEQGNGSNRESHGCRFFVVEICTPKNYWFEESPNVNSHQNLYDLFKIKSSQPFPWFETLRVEQCCRIHISLMIVYLPTRWAYQGMGLKCLRMSTSVPTAHIITPYLHSAKSGSEQTKNISKNSGLFYIPQSMSSGLT